MQKVDSAIDRINNIDIQWMVQLVSLIIIH